MKRPTWLTDSLLDRALREVVGATRVTGKGAAFHCLKPDHSDRKASGWFSRSNLTAKCFGCGWKGDLFALLALAWNATREEAYRSLKEMDVNPIVASKRPSAPTEPKPKSRRVREHYYGDENGKVCWRKLRWEPKSFSWEHQVGKNRWEPGAGEHKPPIYNLPSVLKSEFIVLCEGEHDADTASGMGFTATSAPHGSTPLTEDQARYFAGKDVVIIAHADAAGEHLAQANARTLVALTRSVKVISLAPVKDLTEWHEMGATREQLRDRFAEAPLYRPSSSVGVQSTEKPVEGAHEAPYTAATECPEPPEVAWHPMAREYYQLVGEHNETPDAFHLASFLVAMGVALGRSVYLDHFGPLYPNMWAVLVGKSARTHKDYALRRSSKLASDLYENLPVTTSIDSREGLIKELDAHQQKCGKDAPLPALIRLTEVRLLIDKASKESLRNIIPTLCELYNCPDKIENTSKSSPACCAQPTVSFLAGTTKSWLSRLQPEDIEGGLGNRVMWVPGVRTRSQSRSSSFTDDEWRRLVIEIGGALQYWRTKPDHRIKMDTEASEYWDSLYRKKYWPELDNELISVLAGRAQEQCLKTAMIYAALDMHEAISRSDLEKAEAWVDFLVNALWYLFTDFGLSPMVKLDQKIIAYAKRYGASGARKKSIYDACKPVDTEIFNRRIKALADEDGPLVYQRRGKGKALVAREFFEKSG